jgi:hypothetical protein
MRKNILFIFFITLLTSYVINGMSLPLGKIEKEIFLNYVNEIGKKAALRKIKQTEDPHYVTTKYAYRKDWCRLVTIPCFTITTDIYPQAEDKLSQLVVDTIKEKEKKNRYIPEPIYIANKSEYSHTEKPNNFLENYTRYQHVMNRADERYIELISTFNDKKSLLDILNNQE